MSKEDNPILVEWIDSARPISDWMFMEDMPRMEVIECVSVGWLVAETDKVLMLAPNLGDVETEGSAQASGFIRIPKSAVTRRITLVEQTTALGLQADDVGPAEL
ncbi:hypothetical protein N8456_07400 [Porticoccaceae bacterium]|nr:hypothetical protein [Porticoccaceae bacterium]